MIYNINKFSNVKFKFNQESKIYYINRENPNKEKIKEYIFVAIEEDEIFINNKIMKISYFFKSIYKRNKIYVCLTFNEAFQMNKFNFVTFNKLFPFVKDKYEEDFSLMDKYNKLIKLKKELFDVFYKTQFKSIQNQYASFLRFKQNKKIHYKSTLDSNFFFSIKSGFSDVFKLLENREDRKIYQLDVNSMHPYAMTQNNFSIPSQLRYYKNNNLNDIINGIITNGIFNCVLSIKSNITPKARKFLRYIPINLIDNNISVPINITKNDKINILLHANEIKFYAKYFDIELQDGIYSKKSIEHPLKSWVLDTYQKRLNSTGLQKDFYKFILVLSHSIVMKRELEEEYFDSNSIELEYMDKYQYKINASDNLNNSYINIEDYDEDIKLSKSYKIANNFNVYSLYSQVLANTRIHLLELYEKIYNSSNKFELCYCNIDSLHISIPIELEEQFKIILEDISSPTELGKLKVESISNRGIWFEPGRYWLFDKDNKLISFKNTIFNDNNEDYKCIFKKIEYLDYKNRYKVNYFSLFKSLQHKKIVKKESDNHYLYYKNKSDTMISLLMNKRLNLKKIKKIFYNFVFKT